MSVLKTEKLSVRYGGVRALTDADLTVDAGQLVGLIGPNGAGKTTFIDAATGFTRSSGKVILGGEDLSGMPPHARARKGLGRTWQAGELFDDLTVRENLRVAAGTPTLTNTLREVFTGKTESLAVVQETIDMLELGDLADLQADQLTQGQRKRVGVARALAAKPEVVCLDEPGAGLDTNESLALGQQLRKIVDGGVGMLLVDHDMGLVMSVCDRVVVLEFGRIIADGTPDQIRKDKKVIEAYLGEGGIDPGDGPKPKRAARKRPSAPKAKS